MSSDTDLSEDLFIAKLPVWLRFILILPASAVGAILAGVVVTVANGFFSTSHLFNSLVQLVSTAVTGAYFVISGAYVAPKKQLEIAASLLILLIVGSSVIWSLLLASGTFHEVHNSLYYTLVYGLAIFGGIVGFASIYETKGEKLNPVFLGVGVTLLIGSIILFGVKTFTSKQTTFAINPTNAYVANQDNFQINFPTQPTIKNDSQSVNGSTINSRSYEDFNTGGTKEYVVGIYYYPTSYVDYSQMSQDQVVGALNDAINAGVKSAGGEKLISATPTTFLGLPAVFAHLSITDKFNTPADAYETMFEVNNNQYDIFGAGVSQSEFNNFQNTFKFNQ